MFNNLKIFAGNANQKLAMDICKYLKVQLGNAEVGRFSDGEIDLKIKDNVRGADVFVIQPTCPPVNDNIMELLIMIDALRRASARRITAVMPYYGYARQDRKVEPRVPITSKLIANIITGAGARRILVMDLHADQIQGFFDIPVDHLFAIPVFVDYFKKKKLKDIVVVSPDAGGVERARAFAKRVKASVGFIDKRRPMPNEAIIMNVVGEVKGKNIIIIDDIIDTGKTLIKGVEALKKNGAKEIYALCTHPVLSGDAVERIKKSNLSKLIVTDTIPFASGNKSSKIEVLSIANLLGEAISRIHREVSVSNLFV
ncbi:MAG: ribose-phosphate pyrophosphokinase [bacterium]